MLSRAGLPVSCNNVKLHQLGARCALAPFSFSSRPTTLPARPSESGTLQRLLPRCRTIYVYTPDTEVIKSRRKASKSNARIVADHYDLDSFLRYQSANDVASTSTVYLGTRYEYLIQRHLQNNLGFSLTRIGGKGDGGVDLIGTWTIPGPSSLASGHSHSLLTANTTFRVLIQAKRLAAHRKPMPALMRELEGTLNSSTSARPISEAFQFHLLRKKEERLNLSLAPVTLAPTEGSPVTAPSMASVAEELPTLAILITTNPLTAGIQAFMASSRRNLMYMCLEEVSAPAASDVEVPSTVMQQITWNAAAAHAGLEGYNVGMRYSNASNHVTSSSSTSSSSRQNSSTNNEAILMYNGQPINFPPAELPKPT